MREHKLDIDVIKFTAGRQVFALYDAVSGPN